MWVAVIFALILGLTSIVLANNECVWATGQLLCKKNQSLVLNATVELYDRDGVFDVRFLDVVDPDDKMGFTYITNKDGLFEVEGCADDFDWLPGVANRPDPYLKIHHYCNSFGGETIDLLPPFKVFVPKTYDYYIDHPIILDH